MKRLLSVVIASSCLVPYTRAVEARALQARLEASEEGFQRLSASFLPINDRIELNRELEVIKHTVNEDKAAAMGVREAQYQTKLSTATDPRVRSRIYGAMMADFRQEPALNAERIESATAEAIRGPLFDKDAFEVAWANAEAVRQSKETLSQTTKLDIARLYVTALNILARQPGGLSHVEQPGSIVISSPAPRPADLAMAERRQQQIEALRDHNDMAVYAPWIVGRLRSLYDDGKNETIDRALKEAGASPAVDAAVPRAPLSVDETEALRRASGPAGRTDK